MDFGYLGDFTNCSDYMSKLSQYLGIEFTHDLELHNLPLIIDMNFLLDKIHKDMILARKEKILVLKKTSHEQFNFSQEEFEILRKKIFGVLDLSVPVEFSLPLIRHYYEENFNGELINNTEIERHLDNLLSASKRELSRIENLYERLVRFRSHQFKKAKITVKYMVGESSGGEFFDLVEFENSFILFTLFTNSYYFSSMLISEVDAFKRKLLRAVKNSESFNVKYELESFSALLELKAKAEKVNVSFAFFIYDFKNNQTEMIKNNQAELMLVGGNESMNYLFISNGVKNNLKDAGVEKNWKLFIEDHSEKNAESLLREVFFELFKIKKGPFLKYDALSFTVEMTPDIFKRY